jgi:hypothetical protein
VVARAIAEIDATLEAAVADERPVDIVFRDLIRSAWRGVDQAGRFLSAVQRDQRDRASATGVTGVTGAKTASML